MKISDLIFKFIKSFFKKIKNKKERLKLKYLWHKKSCITNDKKEKYFIIRRYSTNVGLFSYFITSLGGIKYALDNGYLPIVDMKNYPSPYIDKKLSKKLSIDNSWEYFFTQPFCNNLNLAYKSKNYILSKDSAIYEHPDISMDFFLNKGNQLEKWRKIYKESLKPSIVLEEKIKNAYSELFNKEERILGILVRGTDFLQLKPKNHPVQPDNDKVIKKAYFVMKEYNLSKIFLVCEDKEIIDKYKNEFGSTLVNMQGNVINYDKEGYVTKHDSALRALEYATAIFILSKVTCIIGGRTSGSTAAMILSNGFEYVHFWNLGLY